MEATADGVTNAVYAEDKMVDQLEEQLQAERAAMASNAVGEGLQHQTEDGAAVQEGAIPTQEQPIAGDPEDIEDQLKQ